MKTWLLCAVLSLCVLSLPAAAQPPISVPVAVVVPVKDSSGKVLESKAPDGKSYPVFRPADDSPFTRRVYSALQTGFAYQAILLDRYARNLLLSDAGTQTRRQELTAPAYLLLSQEEGGFSRAGFWLQDSKDRTQFLPAGYVDLVVREESLGDGSFEEIFSHELAHQIVHELLGPLPSGPARNMHQSMTLTDYPTAFDEGYAEHFQPLARDATSNPRVRETMKGTGSGDLDLLWISRLDQQLRTDGVKRNLFIHRKALPAAALDPGADRYRLYLEAETSTAFLDDDLRNGQQMMASEGVIATLFYRIVNQPELRDHYREAAFYRPFLGADVTADTVRQAVSPYENANLKLFAAMRRAAGGLTPKTSPMVTVVNSYAAEFPDEAKAIYSVVLQTTRGATASQELVRAFERAAGAGRLGDIAAFRPASLTAFSLLKSTTDRIVRGELPLDANLGPQLWLLNSDLKIAPAIWSSERTLPLSLNLNTATEVDLMTISGVDLSAARKIVAARSPRGFFSGLPELDGVVPFDLIQKFRLMSDQMKIAPSIPRP